MEPLSQTEAEQAVLGSVLLDESCLAEIRQIINPSDFKLQKHAHIYAQMLELSQKGIGIDVLTLHPRLSEEVGRGVSPEYLAELTMVTPTSSNARHYAQMIADAAERRRIQEVCKKLGVMAQDEEMDLPTLREATVRQVQSSFQVAAQRNTNTAKSVAERIMELIPIWKAGGHNGLHTGFLCIDKMIRGMQNGELILLAARPSQGKSAMGMQVARHLAGEGKKVLVFSIEMSAESLGLRMAASEAHLNLTAVRGGRLSNDQETQLSHALGVIADLPLTIDDGSPLSIAAFKSAATAHQQREGLDFIVLDYLQLMNASPSATKAGEVQAISEISKELKATARQLDVPVLALSQLNRQSEYRADRKPQLSDLRGSGSLEQDADVVILLHKLNDDGGTDVTVAKNRNGPTGVASLMFNAKETAFYEVSQQTYDPFAQPAPAQAPIQPDLV